MPWNNIVKGFECEKGRFVVLTDEDFGKVKTESTENLEIRDFVPLEQINLAHFESPYWLEPTKAGRKAYVLVREALEESGLVGVGTPTISTSRARRSSRRRRSISRRSSSTRSPRTGSPSSTGTPTTRRYAR